MPPPPPPAKGPPPAPNKSSKSKTKSLDGKEESEKKAVTGIASRMVFQRNLKSRNVKARPRDSPHKDELLKLLNVDTVHDEQFSWDELKEAFSECRENEEEKYSVSLLQLVKGLFEVKKKKAMQANVDKMIKLYSNSHCKVGILHPHESLETIQTVLNIGKVNDLNDLLVAFDFDQTLTQTRRGSNKRSFLRGGIATRYFLQFLKDHKVPMCVITAQPETIAVVHNMAKDMRRLQIDHFFNVEKVDTTPIKHIISSWGTNDSMSLELLQKKLLALIVFNTDRFPGDCSRIGLSPPVKVLRDGMFPNAFEIAYACVENGKLDRWTAQQRIQGTGYSEFNKERELQIIEERKSRLAAKIVVSKSSNLLVDLIIDIPSKIFSEKEQIVKPEVKMPERTYTNMNIHINVDSFSYDMPLTIPIPRVDDYFDIEYKEDQAREEESNILLCPVQCWKVYLARTAQIRKRKRYKIVKDEKILETKRQYSIKANEPNSRLFSGENGNIIPLDNRLFFHLNDGYNDGPMSYDDLYSIMETLLDEAGSTVNEKKQIMSEPAEEIQTAAGIKFSRMGNTYAARYNKPESLSHFINEMKLNPRHIIFVDDNTDNAMNMFLHFADKKKELGSNVSLYSFWYKPWRKMENVNPMMKQILEGLDFRKAIST